MNRWSLICLAALGWMVVEAGIASAQPPRRYNRPSPGRTQRPTVSPYLNLLRGRNTGVDYYLGVRSEQNIRANMANIRANQNELRTTERDVDRLGQELETQGLPATGAPAGFMTQHRYFNNHYRARP